MPRTATTVSGRGRGFKSMTKEQRTIIASMGGKAAWKMGRAHRWSPAEAREAGRKGGSISRRGPKR